MHVTCRGRSHWQASWKRPDVAAALVRMQFVWRQRNAAGDDALRFAIMMFVDVASTLASSTVCNLDNGVAILITFSLIVEPINDGIDGPLMPRIDQKVINSSINT